MTQVAFESATGFDLSKYNGYVTITSTATGEHRTFRIRTKPDDSSFAPGSRVIGLLEGPDNQADYRDFGFVNVNDNGEPWVYVWKRKGQVNSNGIGYARTFANLERWVADGKITVQASVRCRKCNRPLTDPTSIELGIGPVCRGDQ